MMAEGGELLGLVFFNSRAAFAIVLTIHTIIEVAFHEFGFEIQHTDFGTPAGKKLALDCEGAFAVGGSARHVEEKIPADGVHKINLICHLKLQSICHHGFWFVNQFNGRLRRFRRGLGNDTGGEAKQNGEGEKCFHAARLPWRGDLASAGCELK